MAPRSRGTLAGKAKYAAGDIKPMVIESVGSAQMRTAPPAHPLLLGHRTPPRALNPVPGGVSPYASLPPAALTVALWLWLTVALALLGGAETREIRVDNIAGVKVPVFKAVDAAGLVDLTTSQKEGNDPERDRRSRRRWTC